MWFASFTSIRSVRPIAMVFLCWICQLMVSTELLVCVQIMVVHQESLFNDEILRLVSRSISGDDHFTDRCQTGRFFQHPVGFLFCQRNLLTMRATTLVGFDFACVLSAHLLESWGLARSGMISIRPTYRTMLTKLTMAVYIKYLLNHGVGTGLE